MTQTTWPVPARVVRVHDGDTILVDVDLGAHGRPRRNVLDLGWHLRVDPNGHLRLRQAVRVDGLAAPELSTPEGRAAAVYAVKLLPVDAQIRVISKKLLGSFEKYGRILADLEFAADLARPDLLGSFALAMIEAGHGKAWDGTGKQPGS